ncbi:hypothetical protein C0991_008703 [Blastosporella zonata]|nr:hypothetical protein C0991_008701 [Blastosporella zonata]KAG6863017.1 hypothetical protein C0991_008703 [Blastosporella zonata]
MTCSHAVANSIMQNLAKGWLEAPSTASKASSDIVVLDHKKPDGSKHLTADQMRNLCKVEIMDMFAVALVNNA